MDFQPNDFGEAIAVEVTVSEDASPSPVHFARGIFASAAARQAPRLSWKCEK